MNKQNTLEGRRQFYFFQYKIIGAPKKLKNKPRPLIKLSSLIWQKNLNLSHDTVPLRLDGRKVIKSSAIGSIGNDEDRKEI